MGPGRKTLPGSLTRRIWTLRSMRDYVHRRSSEYWMPCMLLAAGIPLVSGGNERDGSTSEGAGGGA